MKAILVDPKSHALSWTDTDAPFCGRDDVILDVFAAGINRADLMQRRGLYPPPPGVSTVMGLEAAGIVSEVGSDVMGWHVGDRAACLLAGGGYAEKVRAPSATLIPIPEDMSWEVAAAIPEVFYTAYVNVFLEASLGPGEVLLVHAGGSGVGTAAIQMAVERGHTVIATASASKLERISELGAYAVDRNEEDFVACVMEVTQGRGADVILDPVGGDYLKRNQDALAHEGRLVVIGLMRGAVAEIDLGRLLSNRQHVIGSVLRTRSLEEKAAITAHFLHELWPMITDGRIGPIIEDVFDIEDAEAAHARLVSNDTFGKLVLRVR